MNNDKRNELKKVIRAILIAEKSKGMPLRVLERKYSDMEGRSMPLFGYPDAAALLNSLSDTVFTEVVQGHLHVYPVECEKTKHMSTLVRNTDAKRRRSRASTYRNSDKTIIPGTFGGNNGKKIDRNVRQKYSNRNPQDWRNHLHKEQNDVVHQSAAHTTAPLRRSPTPSPPPPFTQSNGKQSNDGWANDSNESNDQTYAGHIADDDMDVMKLDDSDDDDVDFEELKCGDKVAMSIARFLLTFDEEDFFLKDLPTMDMEKLFESGRGFRMFLSQVHSPFKFWFQLNDNLEMIDLIMDHLNTFYYQDQSKLAQTPIPDEFLEIGMTCAAKYNEEWHRGKIVDILDNSVLVFYVDYGTVSEIHRTDTRFLDKQFSTQPQYAFRGCLDRVRPNNGIWSFEAMESFMSLVQEFFVVPMLGKPTLLNVPERTVYLELTDTTGRRDVDIGKRLISLNHAYVTRKLLFDYQQRHYNEVYPSFESLENGSYPSFAEIQTLKAYNYDYLERELTNVIPEMYGYQTIE